MQFFLINGFNDFRAALLALNASTTVGNCSDSLFTAVSLAFTQTVNNKSPLYIFTDVPPNDYDNYRDILNRNANRKFPVGPIESP
jgi:hypothetical protein